MAGRQQNIGGLAISLVADASQLKSTFEQALAAFSKQKVPVMLTAHLDKSFEETLRTIRSQKIDVALTLSSRRESIRGLKRDIQAGIEREGGIKVPIGVMAFSKAQGQAIRDEIQNAVGSPTVEMVVNWRWGDNGPPPDFLTRPGGGGGGGGFGGGFFFGRVQQSSTVRGPVPTPGAHQVAQPPPPAPEQPRQEQAAPAAPEQAREKKRRTGFLSRREDESDETYIGRLQERLGVLEGRLQSASERTRARANNEIARIEKILGMEARERVKVPEQGRVPGDETVYPERVSATGEVVRGPASVGPLASDLAGRPVSASRARAILRGELGIETDESGVVGLGSLGKGLGAQEQNRLIDSFNRFVNFAQNPPEQTRGFRAQRVTRSFFGEGVESRRSNEERQAAIERSDAADAFLQDLEGSLTARFAADKEALAKFATTFNPTRDAAGRFLSREGRAEAKEKAQAAILGKEFAAALKKLEAGDIGGALEIALPARAQLLAAGRAGLIPGVGKQTAIRAIDPRLERPEREPSPAQFAFLTRADALGAVVNEAFSTLENKLQDERRRDAGQQGAETRRTSPSLPRRQTVPRPPEIDALLAKDQLTPEEAGTVAEYRARVRGEQERFDEAMKDYNAKIERAKKEEAERLERAKQRTPPPAAPPDPEQQRREDERLMALDRDMTGRSYFEQIAGQGLLHQKILGEEAAKHGLTRDELADMAEAAGLSSEDLLDAMEEMASPLMRQLERAQNAGFRGSEIGLNEEARRRAGPEPESARGEHGGFDMRHPDFIAWQKRVQAAREEFVQELEHGTGGGGSVPPPVPPGTVNFGGPPGEGGEFLAFSGGPLPVSVVQSVPIQIAGAPEGAIAAGHTRLTGDEDLFRGMKGAFSESLHEFLERGGSVGGGKEKTPKTATEKKAEQETRFQRAASFATALSGAQVEGQDLTPEDIASIEEGAAAELQRRGVAARRERVLSSQQFAQEAVELSPARAVATAAGQVAANLPFFGGRSGILQRKRESDRAASEERQAFDRLVDRQKALLVLEQRREKFKPDSKRYKQLTEQIASTRGEIDIATQSWEKFAGRADDAAKAVAGAGDIMRSFGAGVVGTITGQILFQAALGGTQALLSGVSEAVGPALERLTGYHEATRQITSDLSDQTRAAGGAVRQTVAQAAAQANLSEATYATIRANLEQRATVEAGNKAYQEQIKLIHASANVGAQTDQRGAEAGLFATTGGFDPLGIFQKLGGQSPFFGTPATQELIGQQMEVPINAIEGHLDRLGMDFEDFSDGLSSAELDKLKGMGSAAEDFGRQLNLLDTTVDDLNSRFRDTGVTFGAGPGPGAAAPEDAEAAFRAAGFDNIADQLSRGIITVSRETSRLDRDALVRAVQVAAERQARPDPEVLLAALEERVIPATIYGIQQGLKNQLDIFLPAQRGLQFAAAPLPRFGTTFAPPSVSGLEVEPGRTEFAGVPPSVTATFGQYRNEAQRAIDAINAKAAEGRRVLTEQLGVPESVIAELQGLGSRIEEINAQQRAIQLDVQYSQFNRQLFIANRSLGDLAGLTGRAGATQVGLLQREQLLLSRRSQALQLQAQLLGLQTGQLQQQSSELGHQQNILQLQLQQRQINFQRAIAGFTAPGVTPEERAARIDEAKIEADFAQKQLDFAKQQSKIQAEQLSINREQLALQERGFAIAEASFANQIALQNELNERAYQDQLAAIAELKKAFDASVQIAALEELKGVLSAQRDILLEEIQAQVAAEEEFIKAQAQFSQDLISQTGEFVTTTVSKVQEVFNRSAAAFERSGLGRFLGGGSTAPVEDYTGGNIRPDSGPHQTGFLGNVGAPGGVKMTIGEAGTETVAILRNPRQAFVGVGGGTQNVIQVTVTGNQIGHEADERRLAERIAVEVEQILGRRASQQGFRFAAR